MRTIAVALAILTLPFAFPALADEEYNECKGLSAARPCHDQVVDKPNQGDDSRYFLYLGWTKCTVTTPECSGKPNDEHVLPMNPVVGTLYEDTNGLGGLQRYPVSISKTLKYPADKLVLL